MDVELGQEVGFEVRFDSVQSTSTRIIEFVPSGRSYLRMVSAILPESIEVSHLILSNVYAHELTYHRDLPYFQDNKLTKNHEDNPAILT